MSKCVFCQIVSKKLPCRLIHENSGAIAIMAKEAEVPGHLLVLPKKHVTNFLDADETSLLEVTRLIQEVGRHFINLGYDGLNCLNANGQAAGQSVGHLHIHLIPRKQQDGLNAWPDFGKSVLAADAALFEKLKF